MTISIQAERAGPAGDPTGRIIVSDNHPGCQIVMSLTDSRHAWHSLGGDLEGEHNVGADQSAEYDTEHIIFWYLCSGNAQLSISLEVPMARYAYRELKGAIEWIVANSDPA